MVKPLERGVPSRQSGDRFCTQCKSLCASAGGMQLVTADGLHQRWICKRCSDKREEAQLKTDHG